MEVENMFVCKNGVIWDFKAMTAFSFKLKWEENKMWFHSDENWRCLGDGSKGYRDVIKAYKNYVNDVIEKELLEL